MSNNTNSEKGKSETREKLNFDITIQAPAPKVWQVLWFDTTYRKWVSAFGTGAYALSDWKEGSSVHFLSPDGKGMFSVIDECKPNEVMKFRHLGILNEFKEQPENEDTRQWTGSIENYLLKEENGTTKLFVSLDSVAQYKEFFTSSFPKALALVKELAEKPIDITIETTVTAPIEKVWDIWTNPKHIVKWNNASEDWHTTKAENDLRTGGKFTSRMEAKDGSFGFDFWGIYDVVNTHEKIAYTMGDGRKAEVIFSKDGNTVKVLETFEAETANSLELQRGGWQAILNNFKKYAESN